MDPLDDRLTRAGAAWREAQPPMRLPATVSVRGDRGRRWPMAWRLAGVAGAAAIAIGALWVVSPRGVVDDVGGPERRPVALLTEAAPPTGCLFVRISGTLETHPTSGLGIRRADGVEMPVRWPQGFSAYAAADQAVLVDASGAPVALVGDPIGFGSAGTDGGIQTACRPALGGERRFPGAAPRGNLERPFTQLELAGLARQRRFTQRPSLVVATLTTNPAIDDGAPDGDVVGWLADGLDPVAIRAEPDQIAALRRTGLLGTFAFALEDDDTVRVLGPVRRGTDEVVVRTVEEAATDGEIAVGDLVGVDGWLTLDGTTCDAPRGVAGCSPQPVLVDAPLDLGSSGRSATLRLGDAAWARFGAIDGVDTGLPRPGPWLVRRISVAQGDVPWEVVGRLEPAGSIEIALPTVESWTGACRGVGLSDAVLHGASGDARGAWLVTRDGARLDVVWPPGYRARFAPDLEVLDGGGTLRFRDGDEPTGACTTGPDADGPLLLAPDR